MLVGLVDYGGGNLHSAISAFARIGAETLVSSDFKALSSCTHLVLHGVGAFRSVMNGLSEGLGINSVRLLLTSGKPVLGICVGMQVLAEFGTESGRTQGLGLLRGEVTKISNSRTLPHMGWNTLEKTPNDCPLLKGISEDDHFYFVHSYAITGPTSSEAAAFTTHGTRFVSVAQAGKIFGVQFHPEKSSDPGELILRNFLAL